MEFIFMGGKYYEVIKTPAKEMTIGSYGQKWLEFMRENHFELVQKMEREGTIYKVAESVDDYAWEYRELLDKQYEKTFPRPRDGFEEIVTWERTRQFYTDSAVMRERVLIPHTS